LQTSDLNHFFASTWEEALAEILEQKALEISKGAKRMAEHAGRKTITAKDIELAVEQSE